jgi:DNA repair protein SbcC/Rad50
MRPHRLRVTAFGAFAGAEEVRFSDLDGLFLLHGETGAGKTTLLDAIAFALYGRVPGMRGTAKRLRSDHAAPDVRTEVELEVTIGGRRLRITRRPEQERPKRSGTGRTKEPASLVLDEATAAGGWECKSTRIGEADAEIQQLMGMSAEQFFQVVLLPQGEFAQFLHADAQARAALLQKLFGTDRFRAVEDWLADQRRSTAAEVEAGSEAVRQLMARVAQVPEVAVPGDASAVGVTEPPAPDVAWQLTWADGLLMEAGTRQEATSGLAAARGQELDAALAALTAAEQLADRQRRRAEALRRQAALDAAQPSTDALRGELAAASRAAEVAPVLDESRRAWEAAALARAAQQRARSAVAACPAGSAQAAATAPDGHLLQGASAEALRAAAQEERQRLGRLEALRSVVEQAEFDEETGEAARQRAMALNARLATAGQEITRRRAARPAALAARDAASKAAAQLGGVSSAADASGRVAADLDALVSARASRQDLHEAHLTARERAATLKEEAQRLRDQRFDNMRFELAALLVDDDECPVCGSLDHPNPCELAGERVSREQEEAATAAADAAAARKDQAGRQVAAADAVIATLAGQLAAAGVDAQEDMTSLKAAARHAQADADRMAEQAQRLAEVAAGLAARQRELEELDAAIAAAERGHAELAEQRTAALAEAASADQRAAGHRQELRAGLGDAAGLPEALAAARHLADVLAEAADAADEASRTEAEAHAAGERAIQAAAAAGFGDAADTGAAAGEDPAGREDGPAYAGVRAARGALREASWRTATADTIGEHEAAVKAVAAALADPDLNVELDPPAPVAAAQESARTAQRDHEEAVAAHSRAAHAAAQLAALRPQLAGALAALAPLTARAAEARQLADLAAGLGANQYRMTLSAFVLAARLEEVAAAASQRLLTMTAGRYSLVHTDARKGGGKSGLGLLACDSWTGLDRDTSTLSGGETFLASLALALGLADVVTAEAAGTPMEALFVDEGFGTLDEDALEEVMTVLDGLREGGRMVGIVSHVSELRQRVPAQVHVRKGHHGSHVHVTAG